jgi:hypothetical protein
MFPFNAWLAHQYKVFAPLAVDEIPQILRLIRQMVWLQLLSGWKGDCYEEKGKHYEIHKNGNWVYR